MHCTSLGALNQLAPMLERYQGPIYLLAVVSAFRFGSRNSFVVLLLALALPPPLELAALVVVFQSLVELFGMLACLHWVPRHLFSKRPGRPQRDTTRRPGCVSIQALVQPPC